MDSEKARKCLTIDSMNPNVRNMGYVVYGPVYKRSREIQKDLSQGKKYPFKRVFLGSIGDCHGMGQVPITFIRQVLATAVYTPLLNDLDVDIPWDVKERVQNLLSQIDYRQVDYYTEIGGLEMIRRHCAEYIAERDGKIPSDWKNIALCAGASGGIKDLMKLLAIEEGGKKSAILIPVPQYPMYEVFACELGMGKVEYFLDEDTEWDISIDELKRAVLEGRKEYNVKAIVIINPGNPTGEVLTRQKMEDIIKFAFDKDLLIIADEVYQQNIYALGRNFHSFKKVATEMGWPYDQIGLASIMSCSKGYMGECGVRGGFIEVVNFSSQMQASYFDSLTYSSFASQIFVDCVVAPPKEGDPSYQLWRKERDDILSSLKERALLAEKALNSVEGMSCNPVQGAMYAFPRIYLPEEVIRKAKEKGVKADEFYALSLLEETGITISPGSAFGQRPGTFHFRTTILPQTAEFRLMLQDITSFHVKFVKKWDIQSKTSEL